MSDADFVLVNRDEAQELAQTELSEQQASEGFTLIEGPIGAGELLQQASGSACELVSLLCIRQAT